MDDNNVQKIDLMQYVERFWRTLTRFKLVLSLLFLLIVAFFVGQEVLFFDTTYSSTAVFVATNQEEGALFNSGEDDDELVSTFSSLITGNMMSQVIMDDLQRDYVPASIAISRVENTNLLEMRVTASNAQDAYDVAQCVLNNYGQVTNRVMSDVSIVVLDQPLLAEGPDAYPDYLRSAIKGVVYGMAASFIVALALTLMRRKVLSGDDVKHVLHLNVTARIPFVGGRKKHKRDDVLLLNNPRIQYGFRHAFHEARMKLEQEKRKNGYNTFMVTSTMPDEGKSTISTNLALSFADKGYKVILVDLDLRNPSIVQAIQSDGSQGTIVDYLRGKYPIREIITHYEEFKLDITYGTSSGEDAAELLSGERFRKLIATLKEEYDYVILDAPPLYMMGDALLIGQVSDSALVVIRQDYANIYDVQDSLEEFNDYVPSITGVILNQVKPSIFSPDDHPYGYGYGYGYGYDGYGYGYGYGYGKKK